MLFVFVSDVNVIANTNVRGMNACIFVDGAEYVLTYIRPSVRICAPARACVWNG